MPRRQDIAKELLRSIFTYVLSSLSTVGGRAITEHFVDAEDTQPYGVMSSFIETSIVLTIFCVTHLYSPYANERELFTFANRQHHRGCLSGFGFFGAVGTYTLGMTTYHLLKEDRYDDEYFTGPDIGSAIIQTTLILSFLTFTYYMYHYFCTARQPTEEDFESINLDFSTTSLVDETSRLTETSPNGNGTFN